MENECNHELKSKTTNKGCKIYCSKCNFSIMLTKEMNVIMTIDGKDFVKYGDNSSEGIWLFAIFLLIAQNEDVWGKLKDFKPKYNNIELQVYSRKKIKKIGGITFDEILKKYNNDYYVILLEDNDVEKTTSLILVAEKIKEE